MRYSAALSHGYRHALLIAGLLSVAGGLTALFLGSSVELPPVNMNG